MELLIWICGVIVGVILAILVIAMRRIGTLYIVKSHLEDEPQLLCELHLPIQKVAKKRFVVMAVDHISTRE